MSTLSLYQTMVKELTEGLTVTTDNGAYRPIMPVPHDKQAEIGASTTRFKVVVCGRRWGKTEFGKIQAIERLLKGQTVWWILPTIPMAVDTWYDIKRTLGGKWDEKQEDHKIVRIGKGVLRVRSASEPDNLKGSGLDYAIFDETAQTKEDAWIEAIRPSLSDKEGGALFLGTPKGRNWFWRIYNLGLDPYESEWACWNMPTSTNPYIKPHEIESAKQLMPDRLFRQEYLAEFIEDNGAVFRGVGEVSTAEPQDYIPGHRYVAGLDWAKENDFTCMSVFDATTRTEVAIDRFNQVNWSLQRGRVRALYDKYHIDVILAELNSIGGPNVEALQAEGMDVMGFTTTAQSKGELIESMALAVERKEVTLLNDAVATSEMQAYELERLPSGRFRYGAPEGMHDDTVIGRSLAWMSCLSPREVEVYEELDFFA